MDYKPSIQKTKEVIIKPRRAKRSSSIKIKKSKEDDLFSDLFKIDEKTVKLKDEKIHLESVKTEQPSKITKSTKLLIEKESRAIQTDLYEDKSPKALSELKVLIEAKFTTLIGNHKNQIEQSDKLEKIYTKIIGLENLIKCKKNASENSENIVKCLNKQSTEIRTQVSEFKNEINEMIKSNFEKLQKEKFKKSTDFIIPQARQDFHFKESFIDSMKDGLKVAQSKTVGQIDKLAMLVEEFTSLMFDSSANLARKESNIEKEKNTISCIQQNIVSSLESERALLQNVRDDLNCLKNENIEFMRQHNQTIQRTTKEMEKRSIELKKNEKILICERTKHEKRMKEENKSLKTRESSINDALEKIKHEREANQELKRENDAVSLKIRLEKEELRSQIEFLNQKGEAMNTTQIEGQEKNLKSKENLSNAEKVLQSADERLKKAQNMEEALKEATKIYLKLRREISTKQESIRNEKENTQPFSNSNHSLKSFEPISFSSSKIAYQKSLDILDIERYFDRNSE